jgi:hypothetical protein
MPVAWEHLSLYENRDLISRFFQERHGRQLSAEKAYEVIAHLAQGRGYFESARQATELVRPLLLYYGVQALSRGLILFLRPQDRECALPPAHGLDADGWPNILSQGPKHIPDLPLKFSKGTFSRLTEATSNTERVRVYQGRYTSGPRALVLRPGSPSVPSGASMTLRMALERIPELGQMHERTFQVRQRCFPASVFLTTHAYSPEDSPTHMATVAILDVGPGRLTVPEAYAALDIDQSVEMVQSRVLGPWEVDNISFQLKHRSHLKLVRQLPHMSEDKDGHLYLLAPLPDGLDLSLLSLLYVASYSLGMLVRYYPSVWLSLVNRGNGDFVFPLLKAATSVVEDRFPALVLTELDWRP